MHDYINISEDLCGTACIKMVLEYFQKSNKKLFEIYYELVDMGYYVEAGLDYRDVDKYFSKYGLKAKTFRTGLTVDQICQYLEDGKICVLSVGTPRKDRPAGSGHLVLATGYDLNCQAICFHDPSGSYGPKEQENQRTSFNEFRKIYSYRGFVVYE